VADLFTVTAPLIIRHPSGERRVMAERYRHPHGLQYFELFWHLGDPAETVHLVEGDIRGEGPWKVGNCVVHVLGCHGTDAEPALGFDAWQVYLQQSSAEYPARTIIDAIARRRGVIG